mmetsp:Transcript_33115/g.64002  ORF Transcript_33115/g.64002 Transcript_33115/m.64002 type:complete len:95 (-) Transcript_33115:49-333(-)
MWIKSACDLPNVTLRRRVALTHASCNDTISSDSTSTQHREPDLGIDGGQRRLTEQNKEREHEKIIIMITTCSNNDKKKNLIANEMGFPPTDVNS